MDQTRVTSGYDVEVAIGGRYLKYLLLLAVDTGDIRTEATFTEPVSGDEIRVDVLVPFDLDLNRTYDPDDGVPQPDGAPVNDPFDVQILPTHPLGADLQVTVWARVTRGSQVGNAFANLYVGISLESSLDTDGIGLGSMTLHPELMDIDGPLVQVAETHGVMKPELMARLQPLINRPVAMGDFGTGGRIGAIHMRKLPADAQRVAALGLYVNLILRAGPQEDNVLPPRGDLSQAQNILEPGADITFATRPTIYGDFADDAYHRMARRKGSGYHHPVMRKDEKLFDVVEVEARSVVGDQLKVSVEGEYELTALPDPNFTVHVYVEEDVDADGIMAWDSGADVEASVLADILIGVIALATVPLFGPYSMLVFMALEAGKYITEKAIAAGVVEEKTDPKVDAALLDVAPNRFTYVRRRWDPFFTTNHQIGLHSGGVQINPQGLALWGVAKLTRASDPARSIVIREAVRDADEAATDLIYRVRGLQEYEYLEAVAPGLHRGPFTLPDPTNQPQLFQLAVNDAVARVVAKELDGSETYEVQAIEFVQGQVRNLLVLSRREINEERARLIGDVRAAAESAAEAQDSVIRGEVEDAFDAQGIIPTSDQVDEEVATRKRAIVAEALATYESGSLEADLAAAIAPLARFELSPHQFGRLQTAGLLKIAEYELVEIGTAERYYYRDKYVPEEEPTLAERLADNLHSLPRYRNTRTGRVFE